MNRVRTMMHLTVALVTATFLVVAPGQRTAAAETFPDKQVSFVIGWSAGGGSDLSARFLCSFAEKHLGKPFAIQNMEGGSGAKAYMYIAKSRPDGYTIGNTTSTISTHKAMGNIPLGSDDFEPIIAFNEDPGGIWVKADAPWQNLDEFIAHAKNNPGKVTIAASNPGSITRFQMMAIEQAAGIELNVLSQKGGAGPGLVALAGGHIDAAMGTPLEGFTLYNAGKIRPLGVLSEERVGILPDTPTLKEQGLPVALSTNRMVIAPKGTPPERIQILHEAFKKAVHDPEYQQALTSKGSTWLDWDPERCKRYLKEQDALFEELIKKAGLYKPMQ